MADDFDPNSLFTPPAAAPKPPGATPAPDQPAPPAVPAEAKDPAADLFTPQQPPAANPNIRVPDREPPNSYWERFGDIGGDIADIATQGAKTTINAPGKITGSEPNQFNELVPAMTKTQGLLDPWLAKIFGPAPGISEDRAKELAQKMQRNSGFLDLVTGPIETALSPITGTQRSLISRPVEQNTGIPKEVTEFGLGLAMGRPRIGAAKVRSPLGRELESSADGKYDLLRSLPVDIKPDFVNTTIDNIQHRLMRRHGYRTTADATMKALDAAREILQSPIGPPRSTHDMADLQNLRTELGMISRRRVEGRRTEDAGAASRAIEMLDNHLENLSAGDVASGAHLIPMVTQTAKEARAEYSAYLRTKLLEEEIVQAHRGAGSSGSGANIENQLRQHFKSILNSPAKKSRYTDNELNAMDDFVKGSFGRNMLRTTGKLAPTGVVSAGLSGALGFLFGGVHGAEASMLVGTIAKKLADTKALAHAEQVRSAVAKRSPLYEEWMRRSPVVPKANYKWILGTPRRQEEEEQQP